MFSLLEEFLQLDREERCRLTNELRQPPELQAPEARTRAAALRREILLIQKAPDDSLSPLLQNFKHDTSVLAPFQRTLEPEVMPPVIAGRLRSNHYLALDGMLETHPALQVIQSRVNVLLQDETSTFDIPALLTAISKHLGRPQKVIMLDVFAPSEDYQIAQLVNLHSRKPSIHLQLVQMLVQASLVDSLPHPKLCSCPLCAHILCVTTATSAGTSTQQKQ